MNGQPVDLTSADLDRIAAGFKPDDPDGSPLVLGHPHTDDPAYGWAAGVRRDGDRLLVQFRDVPDTVRNLVDSGRYRNVSVKLSPDKSRLIHVGLLGAVPPAITGLAPVKLSAGGDDGPTIEFSGGTMNEVEQLKAQIAQLKAQLAGGADKDRIKALEDELAKTKDALAQATGKTQETEQAFASYRAAETDKARETRFAGLVAADKILPGEKAKVLAFATALGAATGEIEFAAPDGQVVKVSQEEAYWRDLETRQPQGLLTEFAAPGMTNQIQSSGKIPGDLAKHV